MGPAEGGSSGFSNRCALHVWKSGGGSRGGTEPMSGRGEGDKAGLGRLASWAARQWGAAGPKGEEREGREKKKIFFLFF
jgi:hypothetical protein